MRNSNRKNNKKKEMRISNLWMLIRWKELVMPEAVAIESQPKGQICVVAQV